MASDEVPWHGLWHQIRRPGEWPREVATHALMYVVVPLVIALFGVQGNRAFLADVWRGFQHAFVVMLSVAGLFELQYRMMWPRLVRTKPAWPWRMRHGQHQTARNGSKTPTSRTRRSDPISGSAARSAG